MTITCIPCGTVVKHIAALLEHHREAHLPRESLAGKQERWRREDALPWWQRREQAPAGASGSEVGHGQL